MTTKEPDVHGPVDFVLLEFPGRPTQGSGRRRVLLALVDQGIITVYDVLIVGKDKAGAPMASTSPKWPPHSGSVASPSWPGPGPAS